MKYGTICCRGLPAVADASRRHVLDLILAYGEVTPTALAAELYGLTVLESGIEDHPDNATRFVAVAASGVPAPTGHDRTSIACFQKASKTASIGVAADRRHQLDRPLRPQ